MEISTRIFKNLKWDNHPFTSNATIVDNEITEFSIQSGMHHTIDIYGQNTIKELHRVLGELLEFVENKEQ